MMRKFLVGVLLIAGSVHAQDVVSVISISGSINPASAQYVHDALQTAQEESVTAFILELNTPGGLLQSTRNIVTDFLSSSVPVIVYVHPRGGQAASAGAFITMAANIAAMAPGTNIGAAHPVTMQGDNTADSVNIMMTKATNDAAAFARTIAEKRGRNIDWAESSVRSSSSLTESEALEMNVVDLVASSLEDLLEKIDSMTVETKNGTKVLHTAGCRIVRVDMPFKEKVLDILSDPNIAYLLLMLGMYGLFFEMYNPGSIFPGVVGGICIILAFYSLNTLPVNYAGVALILFGIILFLLEIKIVSHGLLSIGGVISLLLGSLMLFNTPTGFDFVEISLPVVIAVTACSAAFFLFIVGKGIAIMKRKPATGAEGMIGEIGIVVEDLSPVGRMLVHGEYWNATVKDPRRTVSKGDKAVVQAVHDMLLTVVPIDSETEA